MAKFSLYKIVLRLGGALSQETVKDVTGPEIVLLRMIHGEDSIPRAERLPGHALTDGRERTHEEERTRLDATYGRRNTNRLWGEAGDRLPLTAPGLTQALMVGMAGSSKVDVDALRAQIRAEVMAEYGLGDGAAPKPRRPVPAEEPELDAEKGADPNSIDDVLNGVPAVPAAASAGELAAGED